MKHLLPLTALMLAAALIGPAAALPAQPARAPKPPQTMRLAPQVQPQAYTLALTVDPAEPRYTGTVVIDLLLTEPRREVVLHAKDLQISSARWTVGPRLVDARPMPLDAERVLLRLARPLPAGKARLELAFSATLQDKDVYGFFRQREGGQWLAITQFEATGARLAFPLFDEPGWKVPWHLTLTVPEALAAYANTPIASTRPASRPGWKQVQFEPTPPLPSYLLAFAVGDFEAREASPMGEVPLRFVAPRGRLGETDYAASVTGRIVQRLEDYFGMPYPYAKLDSLAIPVTVGFGAMENPGLITYASTLMLATPAETTRHFQRNHVATAAHELAHQWFGNLVTLAWWDDLWLNESFASWMGDRITHEVMPGWGWDTATQQARADAMRADRLLSARRVQEPVRTDDDMGNLWDAITYQKGQTVLAMFEGWLGEARFREGVRRYIQRHAWGNATGDDFLAALGETDASLPAAMRSFTTQPGIPQLAVALECPAGAAPQLQLSQSRLLPLGSAGVSGAPQRWQIPVVVRTPAGASRLLLTRERATLPLPDADCPAWVQANAGGVGYYRVAYGADLLARLAAAPGLGTGEVMALLDDARGLHQAGQIDNRQLAGLVQRFAHHPRREVVELASELLLTLRPLVGDAPAQREAYAAHWQSAFGERARALGWLPRTGESDDDALLRARLVPLVAAQGQDVALRTQALSLARAWLADPATLDANLRGEVLSVAARDADDALVDGLEAALRASTRRNERSDLFAALGHLQQPAQAARASALLLDMSLDIRESLWPLLGGQARQPETRAHALAFVQRNLPALTRRMGRDEPASLPGLFSTACGADEQRQIKATFGPTARRYQGGQIALDKALEAAALCTAWRAQQTAPV